MGARCVCVISYLLLAATCGPKGHGSGLPLPSRTAAGFLPDHILSQIEMIDPSRAPLSPAPKERKPPDKGKGKIDKGKQPVPSPPEEKT